MDPSVIALIGVFIGTLLSVMGYKFSGSHPDKVAIAQADERRALQRHFNAEAAAANDTVMCSVYEIRLTQQKMVDAGIIKADELSVCENKDCKNCYPTREVVKVNKRTAALTNRKKKVRGEWVGIPEGVPDHAYPSIKPYDGSFFYVYWSWTDPETGRQMGLKSMHPKSDGPVFRPTFTEVQKYYNENKKEMLSQIKRVNAKKEFLEECSCCSEIIEDGSGEFIKARVITCKPCKDRALAEALKNSPVRRLSTGDLGAG